MKPLSQEGKRIPDNRRQMNLNPPEISLRLNSKRRARRQITEPFIQDSAEIQTEYFGRTLI